MTTPDPIPVKTYVINNNCTAGTNKISPEFKLPEGQGESLLLPVVPVIHYKEALSLQYDSSIKASEEDAATIESLKDRIEFLELPFWKRWGVIVGGLL